MKKTNSIYLVGPMGVGKTTIGRVLADMLQLEFYDSDREIEASTGADIPWIFDVEGEAGFRIRESRMINSLTRMKKIVLATGGGAVLADKNRQRLAKRGYVVYLRASIKQQVERTSRDKNRPLLQTPNPEKKIRELMKIRDPLYREVADLVVDTNRRNPKTVSQEICRKVKAMQEEQSKATKVGKAKTNETGKSGTEEAKAKATKKVKEA